MANKKSKSQTLKAKASRTKSTKPFPDEGQLFQAKNRKHDELIFFVHFYAGHKKALQRHIDFVNELGFDAYAFNLKDELKDHLGIPFSVKSKKFGLKHAMADQIEQHLGLLDSYKEKIMFAFSNVSGSAIEVMARRPDIKFKALICDSGPTLEFVDSAFQLFKKTPPVKLGPFKFLTIPGFAFGWSLGLHKDIPKDLQKFPEGFPVLSIRGWKDPLIKPKGIDKIFEQCPNLNWQKLSLPEAGHLTGLRDYPNDYKPVVTEFLESVV